MAIQEASAWAVLVSRGPNYPRGKVVSVLSRTDGKDRTVEVSGQPVLDRPGAFL